MIIDVVLSFYEGSVSLNQHEFGQGSARIWLTNVECIGSEAQLINCQSNSSGVNLCTHSQDIGVRCPHGQCVQSSYYEF